MTPEKKEAFDQMVEDNLNMLLSPEERQALEEGMDEIAKALSWFFAESKAHPETGEKRRMYTPTKAKLKDLVKYKIELNTAAYRRHGKHEKIRPSFTSACDKYDIEPETASEHMPKLFKRWWDPAYWPDPEEIPEIRDP